jgi:uncharacterized membrane protein
MAIVIPTALIAAVMWFFVGKELWDLFKEFVLPKIEN